MPLNHRTTTVTEEQSILSSINSTNNNKKKNNNSTKTSTSTTGTNNRKVVQAVTSTLIRPARTLTAIQTIIVIIIMTVVSFLSGAAIKSFGGVIRNTSNGGNVLVAAWSMTTTIPHHRRFARPQPVSHNMMGFQQEYWMHPMTGTRRHTSQLMMPSSSSSAARITSDSANNNNDNSKGYSLATQRRIKGLDSKRELSTLAMKLQKTEKELYAVLTQRLVQRRSSSSSSAAITTTPEKEKDEYVEWLITGYDAGSDDNINQPQPKKEVSGRKNQAKVTGTTVLDGSGRRQQQQTFATNVLFADRIDLHPNSKRAMAEMGLVSMTEIQDKTFGAASSGRDVLGRARTGTGKTVAFFLPAIERLVQLGIQYDPTKVGVLVVSPTRELATQIADQAEKMVAYHKGMSVQVMFGGTNIRQDINRLSSRLPTILVATPGRLLDHLQSTSIRLGGGGRSSSGQTLSFGRDIMSQTPILVLDETDRLLDMGFRTEITKIMKYLPTSTQRQTLLFSATIPPDLKTIMAQNMKKDYIEVDCINDGDVASHTNEQVRQSYVIVPGDSGRTVSSVIEIVKYATDLYDTPDCPAKVVVFFPTARLVNFYAEVFNEGRILSQPVLELHSKKTQSYRTRVSDKFRAMKRGVLFTSDVSARGTYERRELRLRFLSLCHALQSYFIPSSHCFVDALRHRCRLSQCIARHSGKESRDCSDRDSLETCC